MKILLYILLVISLIFTAIVLYLGITKPDPPKPITESVQYDPFPEMQKNFEKILIKKVPIIYPDFSKEKESVQNYQDIVKILLVNLNQNYIQLMIPIRAKKIQEQEKKRQQALLLQEYVKEDLRIKEQQRLKIQQQFQEKAKRNQNQIDSDRISRDIAMREEEQRKKRLEQYEKNMRNYEENLAQMRRDKAQQNRESDDDRWRRMTGQPIPR